MDKPSASRTNNDKCLFLLQKNCIDLTSPVCESRQVYVIEDVICFSFLPLNAYLQQFVLILFSLHNKNIILFSSYFLCLL